MTQFLSLNNGKVFININNISIIEADYCQGIGTDPLLILKVTMVDSSKYFLSSNWNDILPGKSEKLSENEIECTQDDIRKIKELLDIDLWLDHNDDKYQ